MGRRFAVAAAVAVAFAASSPGEAQAEDFIYFDAHPVHPAAGGGFCETAGAHVHDYAPVDPAAFLRRDGLWFFIGDPVVFGYRGTVYRFDGPHEIAGSGSEGGTVCSMRGVHHHLYAPVVVAAPDPWAPVPILVSPWWWDVPVVRRPRPERPHAFELAPPPSPPRPRASGPATRIFPSSVRHAPPRPTTSPPARGR